MKKELLFSIFILVIFFLISSCTPTEVEELVENESEVEITLNEPQNITEVTPKGSCTPGWKCVSSSYKAYQYENCSWDGAKGLATKIKCPLGCEEGACRVASTCNAGFKCKSDFVKAYQTEACSWLKEKKCEWGCEKSTCKPEPENLTAVNATEHVEEAVVESVAVEEETKVINSVEINQLNTIEVAGVQHNLSIYHLEAGRTKIKLDTFRSDWLEEGDNVTLSSIKITITEILFQPFAGGTQSVAYTIG